MTSRAGSFESTDAIDVYKNWSALAGYFDGDGTIEVNPHKYTIEIRLAFDENWKPHLDGIRSFLEERGYCCGKVIKKDSRRGT